MALAGILSVLILVPAVWMTVRAQTAAVSFVASPAANPASITQTSAVIQWSANAEVISRLDYCGGSPQICNYDQKNIDLMTGEESPSVYHSMSLFDLQPGQKYDITVHLMSGGVKVASRTTSFTTLPACTADTWECEPWGLCSADSKQIRTCKVVFDCPGVTTPNPEKAEQSCTPPVVCGNGKCEAGETTASCPKDCPPACTAGIWECEPWGACSAAGERTRKCAVKTDCPGIDTPNPNPLKEACTPPAVCGNGKCEAGETTASCPKDCPPPPPPPEPDKPTEPVISVVPPAGEGTLEATGEPVKGAEIFIELEGDEDPSHAGGGVLESTGEPVKGAEIFIELEGEELPDGSPAERKIGGGNALPQAVQDAVREFLANEGRYPAGTGSVPSGAGGGGQPAGEPYDPNCAANNIGPNVCRAWLKIRFADKTCAEAGIMTRESCESFLAQGNGGVFPGCEGKSEPECRAVKNLMTLGYLSTEGRRKADDLIDKSKTADVVPSVPELTAVSEKAAGSAAWYPSWKEEGKETSSDVLIIDSDRDGLPDDLERSLGTDPNNPDTDGDGRSDREELADGTDPLDPNNGQPPPPLDPTASALVNGKPLEQPRGDGGEVDDGLMLFAENKGKFAVSGKNSTRQVDPNYQDGEDDSNDGEDDVTAQNKGAFAVSGKNSTRQVDPNYQDGEDDDADGGGMAFYGTADPNATVLIFVYSYVPLVLTTVADSDGNFSYSLGDSLADGGHTVYVALTDDEGRVTRKSNPLSVFVRSAQAVTAADFIREDIITTSAPVDRMQWAYLLGVIGLVIVSIVIALLVIPRMKGLKEIE